MKGNDCSLTTHALLMKEQWDSSLLFPRQQLYKQKEIPLNSCEIALKKLIKQDYNS